MISQTMSLIFAIVFLCFISQSKEATVQEHDQSAIVVDKLSALHKQEAQQKIWMTAQEPIIRKLTAKFDDQDTINQQIKAKIDDQDSINQQLKANIEDQDSINQQLKAKFDDQYSINQQLKARIDDQDAIIRHLMARFDDQETELEQKFILKDAKDTGEVISQPEVKNQHQALGCVADEIELFCSNGGLITVTQAHLGQYLQETECSEGCCAPNPKLDCTETLEENDPAEWVYLKYLCDNKTECSYIYNGEVMNECETGYVADYMRINYSCNPSNDSDYVAFTARAASHRFYEYEDIILFDDVITNIGNHYSAATSNFVCPFNGVYSFSVSFYSGIDRNLYLDIMRDSESILCGFADYEPNDASDLVTHAVNTVVMECNSGQVVWARCEGGSDQMFGGNYRSSHFTGFLLHRFS